MPTEDRAFENRKFGRLPTAIGGRLDLMRRTFTADSYCDRIISEFTGWIVSL